MNNFEKSATFSVKGTQYYHAPKLLTDGILTKGAEITLRHEKNNRHDANAIAIYLRNPLAKLGHLPRDYAAKYAALVDSGRIVRASVSSAELRDGKGPRLHVTIFYLDNTNLAPRDFLLSLPCQSGVYSLVIAGYDSEYIGSSQDVRHRVSTHYSQLLAGRHANHLLQETFSESSGKGFSASVIKYCPLSLLAEEEKNAISERLARNRPLYNMTRDGQGIGFRPSAYVRSYPISDSASSNSGPSSTPEFQSARHSGCLPVLLFALSIPLIFLLH